MRSSRRFSNSDFPRAPRASRVFRKAGCTDGLSGSSPDPGHEAQIRRKEIRHTEITMPQSYSRSFALIRGYSRFSLRTPALSAVLILKVFSAYVDFCRGNSSLVLAFPAYLCALCALCGEGFRLRLRHPALRGFHGLLKYASNTFPAMAAASMPLPCRR